MVGNKIYKFIYKIISCVKNNIVMWIIIKRQVITEYFEKKFFYEMINNMKTNKI